LSLAIDRFPCRYVLLLLPEPASSQQLSDAFESGQDTDTAASAFDEDDSYPLDETVCAVSNQASPLPMMEFETGSESPVSLQDLGVATLPNDIPNDGVPNDGTDTQEPCTSAAEDVAADATTDAPDSNTPVLSDVDVTPKATETAVCIVHPIVLRPPAEVILGLLAGTEHHVAFANAIDDNVLGDNDLDVDDLPFDRVVIKVCTAVLHRLAMCPLMPGPRLQLLREAPGAEDPTIWSDFVRYVPCQALILYLLY
jgi:hypothetical protein